VSLVFHRINVPRLLIVACCSSGLWKTPRLLLTENWQS